MTRTWPLSSIRAAAGQAIAEGKALVKADDCVLVITRHMLARGAATVDGDGFEIADDETGKE